MNQFMLEVYLTMLNLSVYRKSLKNIDHNCFNALNISFSQEYNDASARFIKAKRHWK